MIPGALVILALVAVIALWTECPPRERRVTEEDRARARARAVDEFRRSRA